MQGPAMLWQKGPFSLSAFILCPVFHMWFRIFHIVIYSQLCPLPSPPHHLHLCVVSWGRSESNPFAPLIAFLRLFFPLSCPGAMKAGYQIHDVAPLNCSSLSVVTLNLFSSSFQVSDSGLFQVFSLGKKNEVLPPQEKKKFARLCLFLIYDKFTLLKGKDEEKKQFLSTWMNIFFQTSVLSYIVCFYIKTCVYEDDPPVMKHFRNIFGRSAGEF